MFTGDMMDFLSQFPPTVMLAFCGFMLLLVVSLVLLVITMRRKRSTAAARPAPGRVPTLDSELSPAHDLPDLDLLVGAERPSVASTSVAPASAAPVSPAAAAPARRSGTYWLGLTDGRQVEAADVLTVSRDLAEGTLIVQIGNQSYGHVAEITDADARRRLKAALRELAQQMTEPTRETSPVVPPVAEPAPVVPPAPKPAPPPPVMPRAATPLPEGDGSWKLPNYNEMANEPLKLRGGAPKQAVPEINIASAIEAYLQHKLRYTPEFAERRLHILNSPNGGVRIEVDGRFYEAVSDIEDAATRAFIAEAIQEWQASQ